LRFTFNTRWPWSGPSRIGVESLGDRSPPKVTSQTRAGDRGECCAAQIRRRRSSSAVSAQTLQQAGLIQYSRGRITVLDRDGLHAAACPCYPIIRREFDKL
jgi:hypothetical protein